MRRSSNGFLQTRVHDETLDHNTVELLGRGTIYDVCARIPGKNCDAGKPGNQGLQLVVIWQARYAESKKALQNAESAPHVAILCPFLGWERRNVKLTPSGGGERLNNKKTASGHSNNPSPDELATLLEESREEFNRKIRKATKVSWFGGPSVPGFALGIEQPLAMA
ncbi:MAG TPA: hypothetical protein VM182_02085 [Terriglobia bacterium]|nr:hypothetical protein [Terriglobia bacterium]